MSLIFEKVLPLVDHFTKRIGSVSSELTNSSIKEFDWYNKLYYSYPKFRRAHVEVLDRREQNNMWIMHTTIFPHLDDSSPIFGFDIVCTANKVSGVFHDFSITTEPDHPLQKIFKRNVKDLIWKRERELPEWGKAIFSENMIAAGGSNTEEELDQIIKVCVKNLDEYLLRVGETDTFLSNPIIKEKQNRYCAYQRQNPYPVKMLTNFGLSKEKAEEFLNKYLFPEA